MNIDKFIVKKYGHPNRFRLNQPQIRKTGAGRLYPGRRRGLII